MGNDTVRVYTGLHAGGDLVHSNLADGNPVSDYTFDTFPRNRWGLGASAQLGMDLRLNHDDVRGLLSLEAGGILHYSEARTWMGFAPQAGFGIESRYIFLRMLAGPLFSASPVGGAGRAELGLQLGPRVAFVTGVGVAYLPHSGTHTEVITHPYYNCDLDTYDCEHDSWTETLQFEQSALTTRFYAGIQVFFGYAND